MDTTRRIQMAAIWFKDRPTPVHTVRNVKGQVWTGYRHYLIISLFHTVTGLRQCEAGEHEQGFVTSHNEFVGREEAARIAFAAGQIPQEKSELISEDLYGWVPSEDQ